MSAEILDEFDPMAEFDHATEFGATAPLPALIAEYRRQGALRDSWSGYGLIEEIAKVEVTAEMAGKLATVDQIIQGFRELHPDAELVLWDSTFCLFRWQDEDVLRDKWDGSRAEAYAKHMRDAS